MRLTATIEQGSDGTFTAVSVVGEHTIIGEGDTGVEAIENLREGAVALFTHLKSEGKPLPEIVGVEVAA